VSIWGFALPFGLALLTNLLITPQIRRVGVKLGRIAAPRPDRWNKLPTPTLGGVGIFLAFGLSLLFAHFFVSSELYLNWGFLCGSILIFSVGLWDEFHPLSPTAKLIAQILAATLVIALGYTSTFFNPRIPNPLLAQLPNILITYIWLVGITNAVNLLDNMDGLAGGIALIASLVLGYFFWDAGNLALLWVSLALSGALVGFLVFNFPPARIFMGDSGSLFLGFSLAGLAIAQQQQASNLIAVIGVPLLIFLLPIMDTLFVTFTRLLRGESPAHGGRDHTSHRLVAFGLNETQVLFVLYGVALVSAVGAALLESLNYWLSLVLAPVAIIGLGLLSAYLGRVKVVDNRGSAPLGGAIARVMIDLTYRRRLLEVILDFFLIVIAYYLAFLIPNDLLMTQANLGLLLDTLPLILAGTFLALTIFGIYRAMWRFTSYDDILRYALASLGSALLCAALILILNMARLVGWGEQYTYTTLLYFAAFLFIGLAVSRSSFRLMDALLKQRLAANQELVLIIGAGEAGEMALRWIFLNPELNYRPVGCLDVDPLLRGRDIHGVRVLGDLNSLPELLKKMRITGLILTVADLPDTELTQVDDLCRIHGCWLRRLRLEFEPLKVPTKNSAISS
jgi:UDP-GlcNAc:undecaprenyl-phosphate/decaprenyl-phosphate GlcNAc-1-phosphate transferase